MWNISSFGLSLKFNKKMFKKVWRSIKPTLLWKVAKNDSLKD